MHRAAACAAAGLVALGVAVAPLSSASADAPTREDLGTLADTTVLNDLCDFPVTNTSTLTGFVITSADGLTQFYSVVEQDSFSANGKTLDGLPYTFNFHATLDADGNFTSLISTGVTVRVPISQGVTFRAAGHSTSSTRQRTSRGSPTSEVARTTTRSAPRSHPRTRGGWAGADRSRPARADGRRGGSARSRNAAGASPRARAPVCAAS